jgi:hypothetical protein
MVTKRPRLRNKRGAAIIGLVLSLMLFIFFMGLFAFDANRAQMCQRELIAACDASSIAGTAMLTSFDTSPGNVNDISLGSAQQTAAAYAHNMFCKQVCLGKPMSNATIKTDSTSLYNVTAPNQVNDLIALGDPSNGFQSVAVGDPKGRTVMVFCCYGYQPSFLAAIPFIQNFLPLNASSFAGIPQVDAVVVFDYSGSMDDFTSVLFVRREWYWPPGPLTNSIADIGCPMYTVVIGNTQSTDNYLSDYIGWNWSANQAGTSCNVLPPQTLDAVGSTSGVGSAITNPLFFAPQLRANSLFCPWVLGSVTTPVKSLVAATQTATQTQTAYQNAGSTFFQSFKSPGNHTITLASTDYASPPGNYKPVFVSQDGITSLSPTQFVNQYDSRNSGSASGVAAGSSTWINNVWIAGYPPAANNCNTYGRASVAAGGGSTSNCQAAYQLDQNTWAVAGYTFNDKMNFTDLVVNLINPVNGSEYYTEPIPNPNNTAQASVLSQFYFTGFTCNFPNDEQNTNLAGKSFNFANLATLVEASRGNLDSANNQQQSCCDGNVIISQPGTNWTGAGQAVVAPSFTTTGAAQANFQLAYERLALIETQPFATACDGAVNAFFYKMATLCDARFGFVGFSGVANSNATANVDGASANGGVAPYTGSDTNFESMGTSPSNSFYRSGLCSAPSVPGIVFASPSLASNTGWVMDLSNVVGAATAANTNIAGYNNGSGGNTSSGSQTQVGFKIPRTCLTANSGGAQPTDMRLDMVSSVASPGTAPMNNSQLNASQSPYPNGTPYGDIWSALSSSSTGNGVWNGRPLTDTYCDEALQTAVDSFISNSHYGAGTRKAARKAIVFFTDGEPTGGIGGTVGTNATAVATAIPANNRSIVMYTIGLNSSGNSTLQSDQKNFLGDGVTNGSGQGLAYLAGNGGRFFPCSTGTDVRNAFASIARRLSQSQN